MKNTNIIRNTVMIIALVASLSTSYGVIITLDGVNTIIEPYTNLVPTTWFDGHQTENSIYGNFLDQQGTTTIRYQVAELDGGTPGVDFFFLYIEVPLIAKNMIWQDLDWKNDYPITNVDPSLGLTEDDVASYRVHHETHHSPGDMKLNFGGATGSEKLILLNALGMNMFEADLNGNADNTFGLVGYKDSVDYLFDNNLATEEMSLNRDTPMSFEFQFELNQFNNDLLLSYFSNGLEFHLSPERGLSIPVPEPKTSMMIVIGFMIFLRHRIR